MPEAKPVTVEGVSPYLYYEDAGAALDWLARVFGFGPSTRYVDAEGTVREAEIAAGASTIMVSGGRAPGPDDGRGLLLIVHLDDVDAHHARTVAAGVEAAPPVDKPYGPRAYDITDPWGYRWTFWQPVIAWSDGIGGLRRVTV